MFDLIPTREDRSRSIAPQQPDDPFVRLRQEFDHLFDRVFGALRPAAEPEHRWGLDLTGNDKEVIVRAEAPGFEAGDFDVQVAGDTLHITAQRKAEGETGDKGRWSQAARLERWVSLPPGTDVEKVDASYRNGILEVRFPRTPEVAGRKIQVKG
jgi:HSP20 family protein